MRVSVCSRHGHFEVKSKSLFVGTESEVKFCG